MRYRNTWCRTRDARKTAAEKQQRKMESPAWKKTGNAIYYRYEWKYEEDFRIFRN